MMLAIGFLRLTCHCVQAEVHMINEETAEEVNAWFETAKTIQQDTNKAKALANDITKLSEAPEVSGEAVAQIEGTADILVKELAYDGQVQQALRGIKAVTQLLDQVEQASSERRVLDALHLLESMCSCFGASMPAPC